MAVRKGMVVQQDVAVPMRDGTVLRADVWLPGESGQYPILIYRSPYGKTEEEAYNDRTFRHALEHGYALVVQDVRGRYRSGGAFSPYANERKDGYDTVEWAAGQPWSNGSVGMIGLSYPGAVQWLAAIETPPHLKAVSPAMSFRSLRHFLYFGGVFEAAWTGWIYKDMIPDAVVKLGLPGPRTYQEACAEYERQAAVFAGTLPMLSMDLLEGVAPYYYEWLKTPPEDPAWDWGEIQDHYAEVKAAVLNLSGWHDEPYGSLGAVTGFTGLVAAGNPRTRLIIGPWTHGAYETELTRSGDREFGAAAAINYDDVVLGWMDCHVKEDGKACAECGSPVRIFVMGDNRWREAQEWPLPDTRYTELFLAGGQEKGSLVWEGAGEASERAFTSDPENPVTDSFGTNFGAYDLRSLADREDVLTFETEALDEDLEVTGPIRAEIFASSEAPDFDLYVKILDVAPDGTAYNLMSPGSEVLRASYRFQGKPRALLSPGETAKLGFNNLVTSNTFKKGHRIRVCICASWYPIYARNLQTGESEVYSAATRKARITIHLGGATPSRLILPVIPRQASAAPVLGMRAAA
ncbi:MAG: CocE/NonD family hydrolase [Thermodesulfobacteriota bacterium]